MAGGTPIWDEQYGFDDVGNRTSLTDATYSKTFGYGAGNRETSVGGTPSSSVQQYDYKGNVTTRPPLDGSSAYNYTWDAYDRLTGVTRSGQNDVTYQYDAAGRLLKRTEAPSGVDTTTVNYWVGLNRVAEEEWAPDSATYGGRALAVARPDEETAATPAAAGWMRWSNENGAMTYETDAERGKVLKLTDENGESIPYSSNYLIGDRPTDNFNDADAPFADSQRRHLGMWLKAPGSGDPWAVTVLVRTALRGEAQVTFAAADGTNTVSGDCFTVYLGTSIMQGGPWRYWEWDLAATVAALDESDSLTYVDGIVFRVGTSYDGLLVDDIVLSDGRCKRSCAMLPGAAIGGVQGSWTGPNVTADNGNRVRYFYYNDLGTVQAQTKANGSMEGVWEPDFFGNYRWGYSGSPACPELGFTGEVWDTSSRLYYFKMRWYDPERHVFVSKGPLPAEIEHPYVLVLKQAHFPNVDNLGRRPSIPAWSWD
jgi:RHS repeat-associated protein